eukprot:scaffold135117_cov81-Attheya_sp.AAC.1
MASQFNGVVDKMQATIVLHRNSNVQVDFSSAPAMLSQLTSCETKRNAVGNIQHPSTKSSVQSYRASVPAYGQQQQLPMAEMNPPGRRRPGHSWHSTRVSRPDPLIDELQGLYQKQAERDI